MVAAINLSDSSLQERYRERWVPRKRAQGEMQSGLLLLASSPAAVCYNNINDWGRVIKFIPVHEVCRPRFAMYNSSEVLTSCRTASF